MTATVAHEPISAPGNDPALSRIEDQLRKGSITLTDLHGEPMELPESLRDLLLRGVHELRRGNRVTLLSLGRQLTTQQAAELLGVSRPYLVRLLEQGALPYEMVGTHRRLRLDDVLTYRRERSERRRAALRDLSDDADDLGIYTS
jgi:excisionase family DNA binding protein